MFLTQTKDSFPIYINKKTGTKYAVVKLRYKGSSLDPNTVVKMWAIKLELIEHHSINENLFTPNENLFDIAEIFEFPQERQLLYIDPEGSVLHYTATTTFAFIKK